MASNPKTNGTARASLQTRLVLFTLFISLVPLVAISIRDIFQTQQALTSSAEQSLRASAEQTASSVDTFIRTTLEAISIESQISDFAEYLSLPPELRPGSIEQIRAQDLLIKLASKNQEHILSYALVDAEGNILLDSAPQILAMNEADEPYFQQVRFSTEPVLTDVIFDENDVPTISFANRILDSDGNYVGVLRLKYEAHVMDHFITEGSQTSRNALVLLLDPVYIRLADSRNPSLNYKSVAPLSPVDYLLALEAGRLQKNLSREEQATNFTEFEDALDNSALQPFFQVDITPNVPGNDTVAVAAMSTRPWLVVYSQPTSDFLADVQSQTQTNAILVVAASILVAIIATLVGRALTNPIIALTKVANTISQGDLSARTNINSTDEIGLLATTFNSMADQLQSTLIGLEQRIYERTEELEKNKLELETIADVAREIAVIRDLDTLLNVAANLIRERLSFYHVGIFLVDERGEYAILRGASSIAADQMLARNYKLKVGKTGLVGNVTNTGQAYIALDVGLDAVHFENPFLPDTRSEIALPLRSRSITIGALDIQATVPNAFDEQDIQTLQILADQLAAAIENAQLVQQVEGALNELTRTNRTQTQQIWQTAIEDLGIKTYEYDGLQIKATPQNLPPELLKRLEGGRPVVVQQHNGHASQIGEHKTSTLLIPLMVLNQVIGVIGLEQEDPNHIWNEEEITVAQAAANRAALTLENARLLEESQRRASKERAIFEATSRIGSALSIENILQATAEEMERVVGSSEIILQFHSGYEPKAEK